MAIIRDVTSTPTRGPGNAFLLAQLGAHAASAFTDRIRELDLTPAQAGLLRLVAAQPGLSQQAIARTLGTPASRLVALVDDLQERGILERRRKIEDRRHYAVHLTEAGGRFMGQLGQVARAHDEAITAALSMAERKQLKELLQKISAEQGLTPGVHPGYRSA